MPVVALTSLAMSEATSSRHPSGKKLYEIADYVLDNGGLPGDAALEPPGFPHKVGPTSTLTGALLLNLLSMEIIEGLLAKGLVPPTYVSQNSDGGASTTSASPKNTATASVARSSGATIKFVRLHYQRRSSRSEALPTILVRGGFEGLPAPPMLPKSCDIGHGADELSQVSRTSCSSAGCICSSPRRLRSS